MVWHFNCTNCGYNGHGTPSWDITATAESHGYRLGHLVKVWKRGKKVEARTVGRRDIGGTT